MKTNKIILILAVFLLALLPLSSALNVTESHGIALSGGSLSEKRGLAFTFNNLAGNNFTGLNVTQIPTGTATRVYVALASTPTTYVYNATFSGQSAVIPFGALNLTKGSKYVFIFDNAGSAYTSSNEGGSSVNNQAGTFGNWTGCFYSGAVQSVPCVAVNILSITISNDTYPTPATPTPSISFAGQTPANNSRVYINDSVVINATVSNMGNTYIELLIYNSSLGYVKGYCVGCSVVVDPMTSLGSSDRLSLQANFTFQSLGFTEGLYYYQAGFNNGTVSNLSEMRQLNVSNWTAIVNITAVNAISGVAISNFSGWVYQSETGRNNSFSTTNGQALVQTLNGNITAYIDAEGYSLLSNTTLSSFNVSVTNFSTFNKQFRLYETNTLNITFFDEAMPTTLLTGLNITLDLISTLYSSTQYTTNGTMYLTLLTPESYTLRYYAPNYAERFYAVTVDNRSFQNIQLYMINGSATTNITIRVVNQVLNPIQGAVVKALKYNLATNTYILQEIDTTDVDGKVIMALTFNDEYYKFIVEYPSGTVSLITNPAYITSTDFTISINFGEDIIQEYSQFESIVYALSFTPSTLNYRFDFTDVSNIASEYCLYVYKFNNGSQTLTNTSCSTGSSGTILAGVTNISGTVYLAKATYNQDGVEKFLTSLFYEFPSSTSLGTDYGLFLQLLLSIGFAAFFVLNIVVGLMAIPFSLILGKIIGLNVFSWAALLALQTAFIIIGVLMVRK